LKTASGLDDFSSHMLHETAAAVKNFTLLLQDKEGIWLRIPKVTQQGW